VKSAARYDKTIKLLATEEIIEASKAAAARSTDEQPTGETASRVLSIKDQEREKP